MKLLRRSRPVVDDRRRLMVTPEGIALPIRLALLADSATQLITQAIIGYGLASAIDYTLYEPNDHTDQDVFDPSSDLYAFHPDFVITHLFVIVYEEPTLRRLFGDEYRAYCARVHRWRPRRPGPAGSPPQQNAPSPPPAG